MCMCVCLHVCLCASCMPAHGRQRRMANALGSELQMAVSCPVGAGNHVQAPGAWYGLNLSIVPSMCVSVHRVQKRASVSSGVALQEGVSHLVVPGTELGSSARAVNVLNHGATSSDPLIFISRQNFRALPMLSLSWTLHLAGHCFNGMNI